MACVHSMTFGFTASAMCHRVLRDLLRSLQAYTYTSVSRVLREVARSAQGVVSKKAYGDIYIDGERRRKNLGFAFNFELLKARRTFGTSGYNENSRG